MAKAAKPLKPNFASWSVALLDVGNERISLIYESPGLVGVLTVFTYLEVGHLGTFFEFFALCAACRRNVGTIKHTNLGTQTGKLLRGHNLYVLAMEPLKKCSESTQKKHGS